METLGFVGLGRMGAPIAGRLIGAGYQTWGYDAAGTEERAPAGMRVAAGAGEVAERADIVLLSLPHGEICVEVCRELLAAGEPRVRTVVDLSTIGMGAARRCAELFGEAGGDYVDAPVSGGVAGAATGALAMMVGAPGSVMTRVAGVLDIVAQRRFHVGERPGHGQAAKLLNNYVSSLALAATSEAVVFGSRVGLDMEQMVDVLNASSGRTTASSDKFPRSVVPRTYDFGFAADAMRKDVGLFLEDARGVGVESKLAQANDDLWGSFIQECPGTDFTYIHRYLETATS